MRMLFATTAGAGHLGPLVPVAKAAVEMGHDVVVAGPASFEASVQAAGLPFRPVGERTAAERDALFGRLRGTSFEESNAIMVRDGYAGIFARAAFPAMLDLVERWRPDIVVRETAEVASMVAAEALQRPHAHVPIGLMTLSAYVRDEASDAIADRFRDAGLGVDRLADALDAPIISLTPPTLEDPGHGAIGTRIRAGERPTPGRRSDAGRPMVFVTLGSEAAGQGLFPDLYTALLGVLGPIDADLVVALGMAADPAALGPLPPGVRVERWVDQAEVLRDASAVVFHGGYGTMISALAAGTPLVGMPLFSIDQRTNVERVAAVGAGLAVAGPGDLGGVATALVRVLGEPAFADRAAEIAAEIAALAPASAAVAELERLASV